MKSRRHNEYGVDVTAYSMDLNEAQADLNKTFAVLNAHAGLVEACKRLVYIEGEPTICGYCQCHKTKHAAGCPVKMARAALADLESKP